MSYEKMKKVLYNYVYNIYPDEKKDLAVHNPHPAATYYGEQPPM